MCRWSDLKVMNTATGALVATNIIPMISIAHPAMELDWNAMMDITVMELVKTEVATAHTVAKIGIRSISGMLGV